MNEVLCQLRCETQQKIITLSLQCPKLAEGSKGAYYSYASSFDSSLLAQGKTREGFRC
jgi:hypothetical protein